MVMANAGIPITLVETTPELAEAARQRIENTYKMSSAFKSGKMTEEKLQKTMSFFTFASDLSTLQDADLVVEAVFENMEVKKTIFSQLDKICKSDAILATNTSFMDVDEIASATARPANVVGTRKDSLENFILTISHVVYACTRLLRSR
jgi:3-hydroxyacyl-CoA dehydrogenase